MVTDVAYDGPADSQSRRVDDRPLVTLALFVYNQERFVGEALRGALAQTYSPLEIIISDDCSTDKSFEVVQREVSGYDGPHQVRLNRNNQNIGFGAQVNLVTSLARGRLIVLAGGDDVSLPCRVEKSFAAYSASKRKAMSVFCNGFVIDEVGKREGPLIRSNAANELTLEYLARHLGGAIGCAQAFDRHVIELFGPIDENVINEDVVLSFRSALIGSIEFIDEPLVLYRRHQNNMHFKSSDEVKGPRHLYSLLRKHADSKIAIFTTRLSDLSVLREHYPERRSQIQELEKITRRMLREMRDEKDMLDADSFKRIGIIFRAVLQGTPTRRIIRWVLTFLVPSLYLSYQRRLQIRARDSV